MTKVIPSKRLRENGVTTVELHPILQQVVDIAGKKHPDWTWIATGRDLVTVLDPMYKESLGTIRIESVRRRPRGWQDTLCIHNKLIEGVRSRNRSEGIQTIDVGRAIRAVDEFFYPISMTTFTEQRWNAVKQFVKQQKHVMRAAMDHALTDNREEFVSRLLNSSYPLSKVGQDGLDELIGVKEEYDIAQEILQQVDKDEAVIIFKRGGVSYIARPNEAPEPLPEKLPRHINEGNAMLTLAEPDILIRNAGVRHKPRGWSNTITLITRKKE